VLELETWSSLEESLFDTFERDLAKGIRDVILRQLTGLTNRSLETIAFYLAELGITDSSIY